MPDPVVKAQDADAARANPPRGRKQNPKPAIRVELRQVERTRKDPDRPFHMADVKIPGPG